MRARSVSVWSIFLGAVCLALAGCSAPSSGTADATSTPTATSTSTPSPTPTPTVETPDWHVPVSRFGLECDTLVDDALATAMFSSAVAPVDPLVTASLVGTAIPRRTSIIANGGSVCEWSNGAPNNDQYGTNPDYVGVMIALTPEPEAGWSEQATSMGMPNDDRSSCRGDHCSFSAVVDGGWVTLTAQATGTGEIDPAGADALFSAVVAEVQAAGAPVPAVTPGRDRAALPTDCETALPVASVRSITGLDAGQLPIGGGWSDWAEAQDAADDIGCIWADSEMTAAASVDWVRDGRWAFDRAAKAGTFRPVTLSTLGADDIAAIRCDPALGSTCAVDVALGPDWISIVGPDEATAMALAEAVVAPLAG